MNDAIEKAGFTGKVKIGMDVAASEFFTGAVTLASCSPHAACGAHAHSSVHAQ